jgi:hypothetical protein
VSGSHALPPRWPPQCSCVVIESSFDPGERLQAPARILDTLIENAVNHSKIVATEIIDDILKGAVKTDNNSTKGKHSVTDKTFVTWKEKCPCWMVLFQNCVRQSRSPTKMATTVQLRCY